MFDVLCVSYSHTVHFKYTHVLLALIAWTKHGIDGAGQRRYHVYVGWHLARVLSHHGCAPVLQWSTSLARQYLYGDVMVTVAVAALLIYGAILKTHIRACAINRCTRTVSGISLHTITCVRHYNIS